MIRYRYAPELSPPAPFVKVALRCPTTGSRAAELPAQLDIAADRTVLPGRVVEALALVEDGRALFQGFASEVIELPIFLVEVQVHDFSPMLPEADRVLIEEHLAQLVKAERKLEPETSPRDQPRRSQAELLADLRRRSFTPPPGTSESVELLRQDRER